MKSLVIRFVVTVALLALSDASLSQPVDLAEPIDLASRKIVPDKQTAITIGIAVLLPIYGARLINREQPFTARLLGDKWIVEGSLPNNTIGGVATVELSSKDAHVIFVYHSQ
jgi:hypothetical protein